MPPALSACQSAPAVPAAAVQRRSVLYVEDSELNTLLMSVLFQQRPDLRLVVAANARQALRVALGLRPSLLLLDLTLPDCEGSQLLRQLRQIPSCRAAPAVIVTADERFDIRGTGFCERWSKPLDFTRTLLRLGEMLQPPPKRRL